MISFILFGREWLKTKLKFQGFPTEKKSKSFKAKVSRVFSRRFNEKKLVF